MEWLVEQKDNDEIEEVTDEILDKLIETNSAIIAVFCKSLQYFYDKYSYKMIQYIIFDKIITW